MMSPLWCATIPCGFSTSRQDDSCGLGLKPAFVAMHPPEGQLDDRPDPQSQHDQDDKIEIQQVYLLSRHVSVTELRNSRL